MDTLTMDAPKTLKLDEAARQDFSAEVAEWIEAFDQIVAAGANQGAEVLEALRQRAAQSGLAVQGRLTTPFCNTIARQDEVPYP